MELLAIISRPTFRLLGAAAVVSIAASCAPLNVAAPPVSTLNLPKKANVKQLEQGREIYATACTKCHGPARVYKRSDEKWTQKILPTMCVKSKLNAAQTEALVAYVMTARKALAEKQ